MEQNVSLPGETAPAVRSMTAADIAALDAASDAAAEALRPETTRRAYRGDYAKWVEFTSETGVPETLASRGTLRAFVFWLWEAGAAPSSVDRRLTGTVITLRMLGVEVSRDDAAQARKYAKGLTRQAAEQRQAPRGRGQAAPLLLADLRKACEARPDTITGIRDRALLLIAFAVAGRRSEVAGLTVRDIVEVQEGLVVTVHISKTGVREVAVPYGSNLTTCPVRTWKAWKEAAGLDADAPAFRRIDRHGNLLGALSGAAAGDIITRAAERAGIEGMTGHSARAGLATSARQAGKSREAIAATTGHSPSSPVLDRYIRSVDRWSDGENATMGIGL